MWKRKLFRQVILPAYEGLWKHRRVFPYLNGLEETQWLTRTKLDEIQFRGLQRLIAHAWQNCPYYRQTWEQHGLHPRQLQALFRSANTRRS